MRMGELVLLDAAPACGRSRSSLTAVSPIQPTVEPSPPCVSLKDFVSSSPGFGLTRNSKPLHSRPFVPPSPFVIDTDADPPLPFLLPTIDLLHLLPARDYLYSYTLLLVSPTLLPRIARFPTCSLLSLHSHRPVFAPFVHDNTTISRLALTNTASKHIAHNDATRHHQPHFPLATRLGPQPPTSHELRLLERHVVGLAPSLLARQEHVSP